MIMIQTNHQAVCALEFKVGFYICLTPFSFDCLNVLLAHFCSTDMICCLETEKLSLAAENTPA